MALIREVKQHPTTKKWAYIEYSDEGHSPECILGAKEFETEEEAINHSHGFDPFSYEYTNPKLVKLRQLSREKNILLLKIERIDEQIKAIDLFNL